VAGRFPLLLDEHIPRSLAEALLRRGWTVVRVVDLKTELGQGADDEQVFTYAREHGCVVLSSDERALWRPRKHREQGDPVSRDAVLASAPP
jgi:predicted nuclease of predicted toxin-antitoxin system